jgi:hypothetical protein
MLARCALTSEVDRSDVPFTAGYKEPQAGLCRSQRGYLVLRASVRASRSFSMLL